MVWVGTRHVEVVAECANAPHAAVQCFLERGVCQKYYQWQTLWNAKIISVRLFCYFVLDLIRKYLDESWHVRAWVPEILYISL